MPRTFCTPDLPLFSAYISSHLFPLLRFIWHLLRFMEKKNRRSAIDIRSSPWNIGDHKRLCVWWRNFSPIARPFWQPQTQMMEIHGVIIRATFWIFLPCKEDEAYHFIRCLCLVYAVCQIMVDYKNDWVDQFLKVVRCKYIFFLFLELISVIV